MAQQPPRRPTPRPALQRPAMLGATTPVAAQQDSSAGSAERASSVAQISELMQQFDAALQDLQNDPSLDRDTRELLRQQFSQAMEDIQQVEGAPAGIPDRAMWMDAVQALQASGEVSEDEVNQLIRQINQALEPLQRRESQLAIEFSRRLQTEGQENALAWFREASTAQSGSDKDVHAAPSQLEASPPSRSEVINSRSRSLRGPPKYP